LKKKANRKDSDELKMVGDLDISKIIDDAMKERNPPNSRN